jgi:two-component system, response regulator FlrC
MRLLIIGTLDGQIGAASQIAIAQGATVAQADDIDGGLNNLRSGKGADLVMVDVKLDIPNLMTSLKAERISVPVIACGIGNDAQAAVRAIKAGAKEYVPLPPNAELIGAVLAAVTEEAHTIVHQSPQMDRLLELGLQVAPSTASILITGSSGTGKELMARFLHNNSKRKAGPFIAINCAAIPENLLESELFGHEKGAFTGAVARRLGKFEEANNGTLLLDEISEMDPRLQSKLLRAIQEREIDRVGGSKPVKVDVRIVATSNRDMDAEVRAGNFREDLFFRLNVMTLDMPSLADRTGDVSVLAEYFVKKYAEANEVAALPLSKDAEKMLAAHSWPGNVRELENTMHRAVLLSNGEEIGTDAIMITGAQGATTGASSSSDADASAAGMVGRTVAEVERDLIIDTLQHCLGNRTHAANILGISIRTLRNKLKLYTGQGFDVPHPGDGEQPAI